MANRPYNVLFLCTANSARSIMAEVLLNAMGDGKFKAFSAGSSPKGEVSPYALELLERNRLSTRGLRSKSWNEFSGSDAPPLDFVFTVCDQAAAEVCPVWPGQPMTAHWGIEDPDAFLGPEEAKRKAFFKAYSHIQHRLSILANLPMDKLDRLALQKRLDAIGQEKRPEA